MSARGRQRAALGLDEPLLQCKPKSPQECGASGTKPQGSLLTTDLSHLFLDTLPLHAGHALHVPRIVVHGDVLSLRGSEYRRGRNQLASKMISSAGSPSGLSRSGHQPPACL